MSSIQPTSPAGLVDAIVRRVPPGRARVLIDGADAAEPERLADLVVAALAPRRSVHVTSRTFWRQASLRFEHGRQNPDAWLHEWLDEGALRREALSDFPATGRALPRLRDPETDRSYRDRPIVLPVDGVLVVSGSGLLGRGLPAELTVHVHMSASALDRRTRPEWAWTLSALAGYEDERRPDDLADLVVRADDPRHPALVVSAAPPPIPSG